ncbi:MAG: hypothetical protein WA771_15915 [Chthoniobacterales bacterium]
MILVGLFGLTTAWAQEEAFVIVQDEDEILLREQTEVITVQPDPAVSGVVAEIFDVQRPWQLVNPAAPESYGNGRKNETVSEDPERPGKPRGFILFALDW